MMATHTVLHPLLVQSGAIKALCRSVVLLLHSTVCKNMFKNLSLIVFTFSLLSDSESLERILIDALSAMMIFCKYENYRKQG